MLNSVIRQIVYILWSLVVADLIQFIFSFSSCLSLSWSCLTYKSKFLKDWLITIFDYMPQKRVCIFDFKLSQNTALTIVFYWKHGFIKLGFTIDWYIFYRETNNFLFKAVCLWRKFCLLFKAWIYQTGIHNWLITLLIN